MKSIQPDLLTTCNWGSIEWTMANSFHPVCPEIHHERGFGPDEVVRQKPLRVLARRIFLARVSKLVVPSRHLVMVAQQVWAIKSHRILHIPNGLDCTRFEVKSREPSHGRDIIIGTVARLRKEKNIPRLLRIFFKAPPGATLPFVDRGERTGTQPGPGIVCGLEPLTSRLTPEKILKGMSVEKRLRGLSPEEILKRLTREEIET